MKAKTLIIFMFGAFYFTSTNAQVTKWDILGNGGITNSNFIGPTTLVPFNIKIDGKRAGKIDPVLFNTFLGYTSIRHNGFIAQEVEKAANEVGFNFDGVHKPENDNDYYTIAYSLFVVPLVKAVQEQQKMIETLQSELATLTNEVRKNKGSAGSSNSAKIDVSLSNKNIVVLEQNVPNPFAEQTTISYFLPENTKNASINFYDLSGKNIKSVSITEKGNGTLTVFASDLSNGTYSYSLVVGGKIAETKKMVRSK
jgi:trimeric autotransporter adhesin